MKDSGQSVVVVVVQPLLDKVERKGGWNAVTQRRKKETEVQEGKQAEDE